jgi:hypothetical protein
LSPGAARDRGEWPWKDADLLFEPDEVRKVQDFIKKVANDPAWFDH